MSLIAPDDTSASLGAARENPINPFTLILVFVNVLGHDTLSCTISSWLANSHFSVDYL